MDEDVVIAAFLARYWDDRANDRELSLAAYQQLFPGYEELLAMEFASIAGSGASGARDGGAAHSSDPAVAGGMRTVGPYRIMGEIARGGQGEVFVAEDTRLHRTI